MITIDEKQKSEAQAFRRKSNNQPAGMKQIERVLINSDNTSIGVLDKDVVKRAFELNCELNFNYSKNAENRVSIS